MTTEKNRQDVPSDMRWVSHEGKIWISNSLKVWEASVMNYFDRTAMSDKLTRFWRHDRDRLFLGSSRVEIEC